MRLEQENDDLAHELVTSKIALRKDLDNVSVMCVRGRLTAGMLILPMKFSVDFPPLCRCPDILCTFSVLTEPPCFPKVVKCCCFVLGWGILLIMLSVSSIQFSELLGVHIKTHRGLVPLPFRGLLSDTARGNSVQCCLLSTGR